ncbi:UMTA protein [Colletotrichum acutatum]
MAVFPDYTAATSHPIASSSGSTTSAIAVDPIIENEQTTDAEIERTGIWAIDFADVYPSAGVIVVDISPIQPGWVPPNSKFQIDDIEQPWTWPISHFDYVHVSHLEGSVADWPRLYDQTFAHTKPGGFVEVKEIDVELCSQVLAELNEDHVYKRWGKLMLEAMDRLGKTGTHSRNHGIAKGLEAAGFVDIVEQQWAAPIGAWPMDSTLKEVEPSAAVMGCMIELENWWEPLLSQASPDGTEEKTSSVNIETLHC